LIVSQPGGGQHLEAYEPADAAGLRCEGGREGLLPFLETKTVILEGRPAGYEDTVL
jgi:hypothetical protein